MNAMPVLRGLDERIKTESTPEFDKLMADCGSLLTEAPWQPDLLKFEPWDLPADYELPPMPFHMAFDRIKRLISSRSDTQLMQVIS